MLYTMSTEPVDMDFLKRVADGLQWVEQSRNSELCVFDGVELPFVPVKPIEYFKLVRDCARLRSAVLTLSNEKAEAVDRLNELRRTHAGRGQG